ncbi:MAG TPA: hypothetical protein VEL07_21170 [Planctomycetota bacterium]|nr:hypothetical protein [Planctomycetota bacterium]
MNPQALSFVIALALVVLAAVWRGLAQDEPILLDPPRTDSDAVVPLVASTPVIPPFEAFHVNNLNPFVPFAVREAERQKIENPTPPQPEPEIPTRPPAPELPPEPLRLPILTRARDPVPECIGLHSHHRSGRRALQVRMRAGEAASAVAVGDTADGWRLDAIDGTTARWTSPAGEQRAFVIAPASRNPGIGGGSGAAVEVDARPEDGATDPDHGTMEDRLPPPPPMGE